MKSVTALTHDRLTSMLDYNPHTGVFTWKGKTAKGTKVGSVAGAKPAKNGYRYVSIDRVDHLAQRLAWFHVNGKWPDGYIRFKNDDRLDCRIDNLVDTAVTLPVSGFDHKSPEGRAAYGRARRAAQPLVYRDKELRKSFGIGLEQYEQMFKAQGGVCAICGETETAARGGKDLWLAVDHCHKTGALRGLLCSNCNRGIGCFGDDRERLASAIAYIDKHAAATAANVVSFKKAEDTA